MTRLFDRLRALWSGGPASARAPSTSLGQTPVLPIETVSFPDPAAAAGDPRAWFELFAEAARKGASVSPHALGVMRQAVGRQPAAAEDRALLAVRHLVRLPTQGMLAGERFGSLLAELHEPEVLVLALLAAGGDGSGEQGDAVARTTAVADRLHLGADASQTIEFLVRQRGEMARSAFRSDAEDPDVVRALAVLCGTEERLKMLTLATLATLAGAGPGALTPWKEELLWRLYVDTYNDLTMAYGDEVIDQDEASLAALVEARPADIPESELSSFVAGFPRRYLTMFDAEEIYRHVRLCRAIAPDDVHFSLTQAGEVWELTVVTLDKPFLFSNVCGVLSFFDMNILRGHALTSRGLLVVDVFQFTDPTAVFQREPGARAELESLLSDVVARRTEVADLLDRKPQPPGAAAAAPVIYFDDQHSRRYTVLELVAPDRPGLLYRISRVISQHELDVELVLISTEGHKAIDVFHLSKDGDKIADSDQLALTEALERALASDAADLVRSRPR